VLKLDVETKLAAARTRLIIDKPFLGALVLRLPLVAARPDWCRTTSTDARKLYYNTQYIEHLSLAETQFVLAQEALHCALSHFARRGHRVKHLWDLACDFAINPILIHDGLTAPPGAFYSHEYEGMTARRSILSWSTTRTTRPAKRTCSISRRNRKEGRVTSRPRPIRSRTRTRVRASRRRRRPTPTRIPRMASMKTERAPMSRRR
jgi:hypothetical protein